MIFSGESDRKERDKEKAVIVKTLREHNLPEDVIFNFEHDLDIRYSQIKDLPVEYQEYINNSEEYLNAKYPKGVTIYSMFFGFILLAFFMTIGLVGWLLVMQKKILQCNTCGAVQPAS